jgi:hypothetical protein
MVQVLCNTFNIANRECGPRQPWTVNTAKCFFLYLLTCLGMSIGGTRMQCKWLIISRSSQTKGTKDGQKQLDTKALGLAKTFCNGMKCLYPTGHGSWYRLIGRFGFCVLIPTEAATPAQDQRLKWCQMCMLIDVDYVVHVLYRSKLDSIHLKTNYMIISFALAQQGALMFCFGCY